MIDPARVSPPCLNLSHSRFVVIDLSFPFLLLSDFDGGQGNRDFEEKDQTFDEISGNVGNGGLNGFARDGDLQW